MSGIGVRITDKHHQHAQKHDGMMSRQHNTQQKKHVYGNDYRRHGWTLPLGALGRGGSILNQGGTHDKGQQRGIDKHGSSGTPTKVLQHIKRIPLKSSRYHQYRRRSIRGKDTAERNINKQHTYRHVLETCTSRMLKIAIPEQ